MFWTIYISQGSLCKLWTGRNPDQDLWERPKTEADITGLELLSGFIHWLSKGSFDSWWNPRVPEGIDQSQVFSGGTPWFCNLRSRITTGNWAGEGFLSCRQGRTDWNVSYVLWRVHVSGRRGPNPWCPLQLWSGHPNSGHSPHSLVGTVENLFYSGWFAGDSQNLSRPKAWPVSGPQDGETKAGGFNKGLSCRHCKTFRQTKCYAYWTDLEKHSDTISKSTERVSAQI